MKKEYNIENEKSYSDFNMHVNYENNKKFVEIEFSKKIISVYLNNYILYELYALLHYSPSWALPTVGGLPHVNAML